MLLPLVVFAGARRAVLVSARRRRSLADSVGADRPSGAADRAAAARRDSRSTARRCPASIRPRSRARSASSMSGRRGACPAMTRRRCSPSSARTSACSSSASITRTRRQRAALPRPLRQSVRRRRRRRQRPRRHRMGRLWRAGNIHRRPRRHHRLQAGRPDHAGQYRQRAEARDRQGAEGGELEHVSRHSAGEVSDSSFVLGNGGQHG